MTSNGEPTDATQSPVGAPRTAAVWPLLIVCAGCLALGCNSSRPAQRSRSRPTYQREAVESDRQDQRGELDAESRDGALPPHASLHSGERNRIAGAPGGTWTEDRSRWPGHRESAPHWSDDGDSNGSSTNSLEFNRPAWVAEQRTRLAASPNDAVVQNIAGRILVECGEIQEGTAALRKAVSLAPNETQFSLDLASALVLAGDKKAAHAALIAALEHHPDDPHLTVPLARVCESLEDWNSAARWYAVASRAVEFGDDDEDGNHQLWRRQQARCLYRLGRYREARELFAASISPDDPNLSLGELAQFGDACLRTEDYSTAQRLFDEVSRRSSNRSRDVELLRGLCALRRGDRTTARKIASSALEFWPGDARLNELVTLADAPQGPQPPDQHAEEPNRLAPEANDAEDRAIPLKPADTARQEDPIRRTARDSNVRE